MPALRTGNSRRHGIDNLASADRGGAAKDHEVDERVGAETVRTMHRGTTRFAHGHQARHDGGRIVRGRVEDFTPVVRRDTAHVVMHRRKNRDRLLGDVDTGEDACALSEMPGRRSCKGLGAAGG